MKLDKIYIISLDATHVEAQQKISANLAECDFDGMTDYEIMQAYDGRMGDMPKGMSKYAGWNLGKDHWNKWWSRDVLPGEVGCSVSHIMVWKKIVELGIERTLILEDDFNPNGSVAELNEPTVDWDLIFLGRSIIDKETLENKVEDIWMSPRHSYNSHAYVLTLEGAKKLLATEFSKNLFALDEYLSAAIYTHRREDIAKKFPVMLIALAHENPYFISQNRPQSESTIETPETNPNLRGR